MMMRRAAHRWRSKVQGLLGAGGDLAREQRAKEPLRGEGGAQCRKRRRYECGDAGGGSAGRSGAGGGDEKGEAEKKVNMRQDRLRTHRAAPHLRRGGVVGRMGLYRLSLVPSLRTINSSGDQLAPPSVLRRKAMCFGLESPQEVDLPQLRT